MGEDLVELAKAAWALPHAELVATLDQLHVLAQQVAAAQLAVVREIDGRGLAVLDGASSTRVWLRDRLRISVPAADRLVKLAKALDTRVPAVRDALAAAELNTEQAWAIAEAVSALPSEVGPEVAAQAEALLVAQAAQLDPAGLRAAGARILAHVAPEIAEEHERRQLAAGERRAHERRSFTLSPDGSGGVRLRGLLTEEAAATVRAAIDPLCAPTGGLDERSPTQRRADALTQVCGLALACEQLPDNGGDRPTVVVTVGFDVTEQKLGTGTLDTGERLHPETVRRMACDAGIIPAVLNGQGQILDLGRERRLFTGPVRRALVLRDGGCAFPGCDRPPKWTDAHHVHHWADGGATTVANGVLLCGFHHRVIHSGEWQVRIAADGMPEFIPPPWIDPRQKPRRNRRKPADDP